MLTAPGIFTTNVCVALWLNHLLSLIFVDDATGLVAGNQHWGHATSKDLYTWENQQIAIYPLNASSYIFSGSVVIDENNTSGFFPDQDNGVVAMYTVATYEPILLQSQFISYSRDGGYTFESYAHNPVIDVGSSQFRDPKVVRYGNHWVVALSYASDYTIGFYTSNDLKHWKHASNFSHYGLLGIQYECPNLVEVPVEGSDEKMWLLQISINPGAPYGGSISQYFLGDFDGYAFTPMDNVTRITDFSKDAYAGQFFYGADPPVAINWASNWQYTQVVPTGELENFRGSMGTPRQVSVRSVPNIGMLSAVTPYNTISSIVDKKLADVTMGNGSHSVDFSNVYSGALWLAFNISDLSSSQNAYVNFSFSSPASGEFLRAGITLDGEYDFFIDRGGIYGFDNVFFTDKFSTTMELTTNGTYHFEAILDRSLFETFLDDGAYSSTTSYFAESPLTLFDFSVSNLETGSGQKTHMQLYSLKSTWQPQENANGTVVGNVTSSGSTTMTKRSHPRMFA